MKLLTTKEAAERLHLHRKTVETYFRTGYIKALKVGKNWRVPEEELESFVKQKLGATQLSPKEREPFSVLTHTKLAEVWNHPDEVDYPPNLVGDLGTGIEKMRGQAMEAIKQVVKIPEDREIRIKVPPYIPENEIAEVIVIIKKSPERLKQKISELQEAMKDELFLADLREISEDFKAVDLEGWE